MGELLARDAVDVIVAGKADRTALAEAVSVLEPEQATGIAKAWREVARLSVALPALVAALFACAVGVSTSGRAVVLARTCPMLRSSSLSYTVRPSGR